jgi:sugar/nucleoside kinase (ribokinase family)
MVMPDPNAASGRADWRAILRNALPYIDIFLPSLEEMLLMLRRADYDAWKTTAIQHVDRAYLAQFADELLAMGVGIAGFKLGEMGLYLRTGDAARLQDLAPLGLNVSAWAHVELWQPAFAVNVAGTTGAGDVAYAGFLVAMLRGYGPAEALRWACAVAACCCEAVDSNSAVRTWDETATRLAAGWPTRPERLKGY